MGFLAQRVAIIDAQSAACGGGPLQSVSANRSEVQEPTAGELRRALIEGEFFLCYQPKADPATGEMDSVEALLRWEHPCRGLVPPDRFIQQAERTGMIVEIGAWVLDEACRQLSAWKMVQAATRNVAVNVSVHQLYAPGFSELVGGTIERYGLDPGDLTLEITESSAMRDPEQALAVLDELSLLGVRLSLDDFGVGHSSLARLKLLPINELKVDSSFIRDLDRCQDDVLIVEAIVALAKAMGLKVVAEGVETAAQRTALIALGCDRIQGYLVGRPLPAAA